MSAVKLRKEWLQDLVTTNATIVRLVDATSQKQKDIMPDGHELMYCTGPVQVNCKYGMVLSCRRTTGKLSQALVADKLYYIQAFVQDSSNQVERGSVVSITQARIGIVANAELKLSVALFITSYSLIRTDVVPAESAYDPLNIQSLAHVTELLRVVQQRLQEETTDNLDVLMGNFTQTQAPGPIVQLQEQNVLITDSFVSAPQDSTLYGDSAVCNSVDSTMPDVTERAVNGLGVRLVGIIDDLTIQRSELAKQQDPPLITPALLPLPPNKDKRVDLTNFVVVQDSQQVDDMNATVGVAKNAEVCVDTDATVGVDDNGGAVSVEAISQVRKRRKVELKLTKQAIVEEGNDENEPRPSFAGVVTSTQKSAVSSTECQNSKRGLLYIGDHNQW